MRSNSRLRILWLLLLVSANCYAVDPFSPAGLSANPTTGWRTNGGNLFNQRYSPLAAIHRGNVHELKGVWLTHLEGSGVGPPFSGEAQPIVHDGVIYIITGADDVFAVEVSSGDILWRAKAGLDPAIATVCCGWTSRGVALGEDKVFLGRLDNKLVALDRASGETVWRVDTARWQDGYTITSAPLYFDGMVITGIAGGDYGARGRVMAFNAADGAHLWTFHTVPGPGERGHDTWPQDSDIWQRGGANVWQTPAVDAELGLVYFSTANPGPDFNGAVRAGDNLFADSIVALDVRTGEYRWHFQEVHHDIWDYDASNPVVLFDTVVAGKSRKALAQAGKTGWVYLLDRVTGTPLLGIDEQPVPQDPRQLTAPTQPVPRGDAFVPQSLDMPLYGHALVNEGRIFTPFWDTPIAIKPSSFGATTWAPPAYDPRTRTLFICAIDMAGIFSGGAVDSMEPGRTFFGGEFGFAVARTGIFAAMDLTTNTLRWRQRWDDICYSGATATAGDLVFTGMNDGRVVALDSRNGDALWEFQAGAGVNAPPAVFRHAGVDYVAIYAAGALFANSPPGDNLWLFSLNGTLDEVPPPAALAARGIQLDHADAEAGKAIYRRYCVQCHGADGTGGHGGGKPLTGVSDLSAIAATISAGRAAMPAFGEQLSRAEIRDVALFVASALGGQASPASE